MNSLKFKSFITNLYIASNFKLITTHKTSVIMSSQYTFLLNVKYSKLFIKHVLKKIFNLESQKIRTAVLSLKEKKIGKFVGRKVYQKKILMTFNRIPINIFKI